MLAKSLWELGQKQEGYGKLSEKAKLYEKELGLKHPTTIMIQDLLKGWASQINLQITNCNTLQQPTVKIMEKEFPN